MRTIIAGGRNFGNWKYMADCLEAHRQEISSVICGGAKGADSMGRLWAMKHRIPVITCAANWQKHGKGAGHLRNGEMADIADVLIAFWDRRSPGTKNMIDQARSRGLHVFVYEYDDMGVVK